MLSRVRFHFNLLLLLLWLLEWLYAHLERLFARLFVVPLAFALVRFAQASFEAIVHG